MISRHSSSESDVRQRRPDFLVHLQIGENTTARLFAYRDLAPRVSADGNGFKLNVSIHDVSFAPVLAPSEHYDAQGAMYFSIAVILIYGISIAMLVAASTLRRSHTDYELKSFLRSYSRIDVERRTYEKQRIRAILQRLDWMRSSTSPSTGFIALAAAAPHAAVAVSFRPPADPPIVRPVRLTDTGNGLGLRSPTGTSSQPALSPPAVEIVDMSSNDTHVGHSGGDDGVVPAEVTFGTSGLLRQHHFLQQQQQHQLHHHHHQQQQHVVPMTPYYVSYLPRHVSERSLLVQRSTSEFDVPQPVQSRRNTAL